MQDTGLFSVCARLPRLAFVAFLRLLYSSHSFPYSVLE